MRTEDGYIIQQCLSGDSAAFGLLVEKYRKGIYALAISRVGNLHDAQDITQEVFITAYSKLRTLRSWDNFVGWLYRITSNQCKMFLRNRSRHPDQEFKPEMMDETSIDSYQENQVYESVHEALDSLPDTYREVMNLRFFGGMTVKEISRFLGVSPGTIDRRISGALARLKEGIPDMISTAYRLNQLPATFTFRIVEMVKRIKFHPIVKETGLPWGLSLAMGVMIAVFGLGQYLSITYNANNPTFLPERYVELPIDILKLSPTPALFGKPGNGNIKTGDHNTFSLAPQGEGGVWNRKADMSTGRILFSACAVDGKIYAIGGVNDFNNQITTLEEYDPVTDRWTTRANMLTERAAAGVSVVNGKIYVIGGECKNGWLTSMDEYDPANDKWTRKPQQIPTRREGAATIALNGKIYAMGGMVNSGQTLVALSIVEEYNPATDTWTRKANMLKPRLSFTAAEVNGKIYVFGGFNDKWGNDGTPELEVEEYDPINDIWTKKSANIPTPRVGASSCVINGKIYVIGGSVPPNIMFSRVEAYDPVADKWTKMPDMSIPRFCLSTVAVNGKIYAIGGTNAPPPWRADAILSVVEEYTPEGWPFDAVFHQNNLPTTWGNQKSQK